MMTSSAVLIAQPQTATRDLWDREYSDLKVLPTSTRTEPSRAIARLESLWRSTRPMKVLDAGSGIGRNAIYLARMNHDIIAQDFSTVATKTMRQSIASQELGNRIRVVEGSLHDRLPFPDGEFDLVLDSYVSCHFLEDEVREQYWSEIHRVLRHRGLLFSSQFSIRDEYYENLALGPLFSGSIVVDPANGIAKQLHTHESLIELFEGMFQIERIDDVAFDDVVQGETFNRLILSALLRK